MLPHTALFVLPIGGVGLVATFSAIWSRRRQRVDAVEVNALHRCRMAVPDRVVISGQTMLSREFGASVGRMFNLRRADLRNLAGASTGAAIAAAFDAPSAGAFYPFEILINARLKSVDA